MRFAIISHDLQRTDHMADQLASIGYASDHFDNLCDASYAILDNEYDLVITDCILPDGDAIDWLRSWNARHRPDSTFVIVLADSEDQRVTAFEHGADDCVGTTVGGRELQARIRAILRRPRLRASTEVAVGNLSVSTDAYVVTVGGRELPIQRREIAILKALLRRVGKVVPRAALEHDVYGLNGDCTPNSLEVRISRLRRHLNDAGASPSIETVRGVGYRLVEAETATKFSPTPFGRSRSSFAQASATGLPHPSG